MVQMAPGMVRQTEALSNLDRDCSRIGPLRQSGAILYTTNITRFATFLPDSTALDTAKIIGDPAFVHGTAADITRVATFVNFIVALYTADITRVATYLSALYTADITRAPTFLLFTRPILHGLLPSSASVH